MPTRKRFHPIGGKLYELKNYNVVKRLTLIIVTEALVLISTRKRFHPMGGKLYELKNYNVVKRFTLIIATEALVLIFLCPAEDTVSNHNQL